jgi:hypothetical protein
LVLDWRERWGVSCNGALGSGRYTFGRMHCQPARRGVQLAGIWCFACTGRMNALHSNAMPSNAAIRYIVVL